MASPRPRKTLRAILVVLGVALSACASKRYPHPALLQGEGIEAAEITIIRKSDVVRDLASGSSLQAVVVYLDWEPLVALGSGDCAVTRVAPGRYHGLQLGYGPSEEIDRLKYLEATLELGPGRHYYLMEPVAPREPFFRLRRIDREEMASHSPVCEWIAPQ
jgi:hypothetical protein